MYLHWLNHMNTIFAHSQQFWPLLAFFYTALQNTFKTPCPTLTPDISGHVCCWEGGPFWASWRLITAGFFHSSFHFSSSSYQAFPQQAICAGINRLLVGTLNATVCMFWLVGKRWNKAVAGSWCVDACFLLLFF